MKATIIMPIYNGASTLPTVFKYLSKQNHKHLIHEILLINDSSSDESIKIALDYQKKSRFKVRVINNTSNIGLASTYNKGILLVRSRLYILMHQDIVLKDVNSIKKIIDPFFTDNMTVAAFPKFKYNYEDWVVDPFWQKVLFARLINKHTSKLNGKFDCFNLEHTILFDDKRYRTAGEDFDFEMRIKPEGQTVKVDLSVDHIQEKNSIFPVSKLIRKEAQLAECYGVNLRRYFKQTPFKDKTILLAKPAILITAVALIPFETSASIALIFFYCFAYTARVYISSFDTKIILLPFINFLNLLIYCFYFAKGMILARQTL